MQLGRAGIPRSSSPVSLPCSRRGRSLRHPKHNPAPPAAPRPALCCGVTYHRTREEEGFVIGNSHLKPHPISCTPTGADGGRFLLSFRALTFNFTTLLETKSGNKKSELRSVFLPLPSIIFFLFHPSSFHMPLTLHPPGFPVIYWPRPNSLFPEMCHESCLWVIRFLLSRLTSLTTSSCKR